MGGIALWGGTCLNNLKTSEDMLALSNKTTKHDQVRPLLLPFTVGCSNPEADDQRRHHQPHGWLYTQWNLEKLGNFMKSSEDPMKQALFCGLFCLLLQVAKTCSLIFIPLNFLKILFHLKSWYLGCCSALMPLVPMLVMKFEFTRLLALRIAPPPFISLCARRTVAVEHRHSLPLPRGPLFWSTLSYGQSRLGLVSPLFGQDIGHLRMLSTSMPSLPEKIDLWDIVGH